MHVSTGHDGTGIALVSLLLGGIFCLSGILQHVPVFAAIADSVVTREPLLSPVQTILVGAGLLTAGGVRLVHSPNRGSRS
jgi:hypothetical protein